MRGKRRRFILIGSGLFLAVACAAAAWILWQPARLTTTAAHAGPRPISLGYSPDKSAKYLAATFSDGRVRLWETATRGEIPVKLPSKWPLNDLNWTADSKAFLVAGFEQHVLMWDIKRAQARKLPMFDAPIVSIAVRPRQPELLVSLSTGELWRIDLESGDRKSLPTGHVGIVKVIRFHPNGQSFATGGADRQLVWHDAQSHQVTSKVAAHQHEISSLAFSKDGNQLATGSWDNTTKIWPPGATQATATLTHPDGVAHVAWQEAAIITSCWDHRLRVWDVGTSQVTHERECQSETLAFAVWPGHSEVAEIDISGALQLSAP